MNKILLISIVQLVSVILLVIGVMTGYVLVGAILFATISLTAGTIAFLNRKKKVK